ncbi:MAG: transcriptional repressor [Desulfobacterales bacterium]|nr:transcriptional repressor [Desulfobacterales bacterium]
MPHKKEIELFASHIRRKNLKHTEQRTQILKTFLETERHLTAEELYVSVKRKYPSIGYATVCRTIKVLCECELCRELKVEDGVSRYEHLYGHEHHDHLICTSCGSFTEIMSPEIEKLQEKLAAENEFALTRHSLELYGICKKCNH